MSGTHWKQLQTSKGTGPVVSVYAVVTWEEWKALDWRKRYEVASGDWAVEAKRASQRTRGRCLEPEEQI